jgi:nitrite reductase/ring-hydroxylating ferredoxin subunit
MAARERVIGRAADLVDGGEGLRFVVRGARGDVPAFAIRHRGVVHAYLNVCAHQQVELDWLPGAFFDAGGERLVCSLHGAHYEPDSGRCVLGPCAGGALVRVPVRVRDDGAIVVSDSSERDSNG